MNYFDNFYGYKGKWAFIDLTNRKVNLVPADLEIYRNYIGGRGVQAYLIFEHLREDVPLKDPLSPENRIIIGTGPMNDSPVPTAGRGSCSFIGTMTVSPQPLDWIKNHKPIFGLITHSSCGGYFPNMIKRAGFDHLIIDGKADTPVRILVKEGNVEIIEAEGELFEKVNGKRVVKPASAIIKYLTKKYPGSSTVCLGPAGWNQVSFACLTADFHRNFGRGGAGAVFGSKNLVAITVIGKKKINYFNPEKFKKLWRELDSSVKKHVEDPSWTASFRPQTGTTWWLDRAFNGGYLGKEGGYLPWHNFDEGYFEPSQYSKVSTKAFLEIAGRHKVCSQCRHIMCSRTAEVNHPVYGGKGVRPEFETIALWINCCLVDREAIFYLNRLCNEMGIDTMTFGSVVAGAMELTEKGYLKKFKNAPTFGKAEDMIKILYSIAYQSDDLGRILGAYSDKAISEIKAGINGKVDEIVKCVTTAFGGLGYAGIEPKVFPGMFTAYGTSNRGRGDHTYAWTIQAEEGGLKGTQELAEYVISSQVGKALIDSLGLCDFFTEDITSDLFLSLYHSLTGIEYTKDSFLECGQRIYNLERHINNLQGRDRGYDAFIPPKMTEPLKYGPHKGKRVDSAFYNLILDAYYEKQGWTKNGIVPRTLLKELKIIE